MCSSCSALIVVIVLLVVWLFVGKQERMADIPIKDMSADDIDKLRQHIERAVHLAQFYGDFRRRYPYPITPWQYFTMCSYRKRGELDNAAVKKILMQSGEVVSA